MAVGYHDPAESLTPSQGHSAWRQCHGRLEQCDVRPGRSSRGSESRAATAASRSCPLPRGSRHDALPARAHGQRRAGPRPGYHPAAHTGRQTAPLMVGPAAPAAAPPPDSDASTRAGAALLSRLRLLLKAAAPGRRPMIAPQAANATTQPPWWAGLTEKPTGSLGAEGTRTAPEMWLGPALTRAWRVPRHSLSS